MKMIFGGAMLALIAAAPVMAASPFDGTWKGDIKSAQFPTKPQVLLLKDGTFTCSSCKPVFTVKADGAFHPITGQPYTDEAKVEVVNASTIVETDKLKGKVMNVSKTVVAADGKTAMAEWTDTSAPDGKPSKGSGKLGRVGPAPAGAHAVSGSWKQLAVESISDAALIETLALSGDMLSFTTPLGYSYKAKLGGVKVPLVGDKAGTMVSVKRLDANTLVEEDWRKGELINSYTMTVLPGGKAMKVASKDARQGTTTTFMMDKQ